MIQILRSLLVRLAPSGPKIGTGGAGDTDGQAVSYVWNSGGTGNTITDTPKELQTLLSDSSPAAHDLRVVIPKCKTGRYRVRGRCPVFLRYEEAGGALTLLLNGQVTGKAASVVSNAYDSIGFTTLGEDVERAVNFAFAVDQTIEITEDSFADFVPGESTVELFFTVVKTGLAAGAAYVTGEEGTPGVGSGQCSLIVSRA